MYHKHLRAQIIHFSKHNFFILALNMSRRTNNILRSTVNSKFKTCPVLKLSKLTKFSRYNQFLFLQNTCSDTNFNKKFDYEFAMQGSTGKYYK